MKKIIFLSSVLSLAATNSFIPLVVHHNYKRITKSAPLVKLVNLQKKANDVNVNYFNYNIDQTEHFYTSALAKFWFKLSTSRMSEMRTIILRQVMQGQSISATIMSLLESYYPLLQTAMNIKFITESQMQQALGEHALQVTSVSDYGTGVRFSFNWEIDYWYVKGFPLTVSKSDLIWNGALAQ